MDAVLAAVLAAVVLLEIFGTDVTGNPEVLVPTSLAMTLPLAWRRVAPLPAAATVMVALALQGILDRTSLEPQTTLLGLFVSLYSVGAYAEKRSAIAGLGLAWAALLVYEPGDFIVMGPVFAGIWTAGRLVRSREADARKLRELADALERERVEEARLAVAEERARVARELHDVVAHAMSVIVLEAGAERVNLGEAQDSTRAALRSIERTGRQALGEMRRLVGVLRAEGEEPALAPRPSLAHLDALVEQLRQTGLPIDLRVTGRPVELAPGLDMTAYRIVQEALTNVLKHAGRARATVTVSYGLSTLGIEVADDGRGGTPNGHGHGLTGIRERVSLFGGDLDICAGRAGGFRVSARLPLEVASP